MDISTIIDKLPYSDPFLFVDKLYNISEQGVQGAYTFKPDSDFYRGHFVGNPVTPGVILTECCAQIGLACLGVYLVDKIEQGGFMAFTSSDMEFYHPVYPGETVQVISEKMYFRFNKLKCRVKMYNSADALVCKGVLSGMIKPATYEK